MLTALREKRPHEIEARAAAWALASENISVEPKTNFLRELEEKLWTATTLAEFAKVFRSLAHNPGVEEWADRAIDVCGTGGDHSGSYNISTTVAFILAATEIDIPVFKHGNRAITSQSGSADFLLANGIPLEASDELWRESLRELNFAFFFAPIFHKTFRYINPARKILAAEGKRTIFNLLGPILNPGKPAYQLVGVFNAASATLMRDALVQLDSQAMVVHCELPDKSGLDELSTAGENIAFQVHKSKLYGGRLTTTDTGLPLGSLNDLQGADASSNLALLNALLEGRANDGLINTVCLNAGAALWMAGEIADLKIAITEAKKLLTGGPVRDWLKRARGFFQDHKSP